MKNKWLLISSVSTGLGIIAGAVYLLFAEHSLLLNDSHWALSAFWSAFMLWTFVLMFTVALLFNVLAFFELDQQHKLSILARPFNALLSSADKKQQFLVEAERYLARKGRLIHCDRVSADYQCLSADKDTLVYTELGNQAVDISQIRAMFQQMLSADFSSGIVISHAGFSNQAWIFAQEANIELIDTKSLKKQQKRRRAQKFAVV